MRSTPIGSLVVFCVKRVFFTFVFVKITYYHNVVIKKTLEYWKRKKAAQKGAHLPRRYLCAHDRSKHVFSIDGDESLFSFVVLRAVFVGNVGNARASLAVFSSVERRVGKTEVYAQSERPASSYSLFSRAVQYALSAGVNNRALSEGSASLGIGSSSSARGAFASGVFANAAAEGASSLEEAQMRLEFYPRLWERIQELRVFRVWLQMLVQKQQAMLRLLRIC